MAMDVCVCANLVRVGPCIRERLRANAHTHTHARARAHTHTHTHRLPGIMTLGYISAFSETLAMGVIVAKGVPPLMDALVGICQCLRASVHARTLCV